MDITKDIILKHKELSGLCPPHTLLKLVHVGETVDPTLDFEVVYKSLNPLENLREYLSDLVKVIQNEYELVSLRQVSL